MKNIGYIICETAATPEDAKVKLVSTNNNKAIGEGILQDMDVDNRNGRYYDSRDLSPEVNGPRMKELIDAGYFRAESGHPLSKDLARQQTIVPDRVCAQFLKVWIDGNDIKAQFKGTNNDLGKFFNDDLLEGCSPAWSLRALGSIESSRGHNMVKNIKIITWDHVIYPSHKRAYTNDIVSYGEGKSLQESAFIMNDKGILLKESNLLLEDNDPGMITPITNDHVINYIKNESANIKSIMSSFDLLYDNIELMKESGDVKLTDRAGGIFVIHLENYIHNEIMNYCYKH